MAKIQELEEVVHELEQTTAILGFIQAVFADGDSCINMEEAADAIYMLYNKQSDTIKELRKVALS